MPCRSWSRRSTTRPRREPSTLTLVRWCGSPAIVGVLGFAGAPGDWDRFDSLPWHNQGMELKTNCNIAYSCKYHVVWCPKYRRSVLVNGVDSRLKTIITEVAVETRSELIELEVMPDHVHLLVEVDPQFGIHRFVKLAKGRSSRFLRYSPRGTRRIKTLGEPV